MHFQAVLFDLDGTLLDTIEDIASSTNSALVTLGYPLHPVESYKVFVGDGEDMLASRALPEDHRDADTVHKVVSLFHEEYSRRWNRSTRPFPGVPDMLDGLAKGGTRFAVLSNKSQPFTEAAVSTLLSRWRFEVVLGAGDSFPVKPSPLGALAVAARMGIPPSDYLYLGDSGVDMKTAVGAGMFPAGALWGYRGQFELEAAGARALAQFPEQLLDLV